MPKASYLEDELLLCRLGTALGRGPETPPEDRLLELRAMACLSQPDVATSHRRAVSPARAPRVRLALVGAALGLSVAGGGAAAFAAAALGHGVSHGAANSESTAAHARAAVAGAAQSTGHPVKQDLLATAAQPAFAHEGAVDPDGFGSTNASSPASLAGRAKPGSSDDLLSWARAVAPSVSTVLPAGRWYVSPATRRPVLSHTGVPTTGVLPGQEGLRLTSPGLSTVTSGGATSPVRTMSPSGSRPNSMGVPTRVHTSVIGSKGRPVGTSSTPKPTVKAVGAPLTRNVSSHLLVSSQP